MTEREKVVLLATKVMGWSVYPLAKSGYDSRLHEHRLIENVEHNWNYFPPGNPGKLWNPLTSIADAFEIVEVIRHKYCFQLDSVGFTGKEWRCQIGWGDDPVSVTAEAATPCQAICEAAIAVMEER